MKTTSLLLELAGRGGSYEGSKPVTCVGRRGGLMKATNLLFKLAGGSGS